MRGKIWAEGIRTKISKISPRKNSKKLKYIYGVLYSSLKIYMLCAYYNTHSQIMLSQILAKWPFPFRITIVRNHILPAFHNYCAEEVKRDFTEFLMLGHKFWCFRWIVLALYIVKMCKSKKKKLIAKKNLHSSTWRMKME